MTARRLKSIAMMVKLAVIIAAMHVLDSVCKYLSLNIYWLIITVCLSFVF